MYVLYVCIVNHHIMFYYCYVGRRTPLPAFVIALYATVCASEGGGGRATFSGSSGAARRLSEVMMVGDDVRNRDGDDDRNDDNVVVENANTSVPAAPVMHTTVNVLGAAVSLSCIYNTTANKAIVKMITFHVCSYIAMRSS